MSACSIEGCDKAAGVPGSARGLCRMHYTRWQRHGDPMHVTPRSKWSRPSLAERFWAKVAKRGPGDCWEWLAYRTVDGYGTCKRDGRMVGAHRVAFELVKGPIPKGREIDHMCRNRGCVNPAHLRAVTHAEQLAAGHWIPHNTAKTHCKRGHPFSEENTYVHPSGRRQCRTCLRDYAREWQRTRRAS